MIVGKLKPFEEILSSVKEFRNVLILGCGSCVSVCLSGGDREARALARELSNADLPQENARTLRVETFLRLCERDLVKAELRIPPDTEAILTLACGAGAQTLSAVFDKLPVIPALNTSFLGALDEPGTWREKCAGCGDCVLTSTGGICPIARCAKRLLNGPCGGSSKGKCEIDPGVDCAWQLIIDRLTALDRLDEYEKIHPAKDWSTDRGKGPRCSQRAANEPFQ
jgi:ferredoxin